MSNAHENKPRVWWIGTIIECHERNMQCPREFVSEDAYLSLQAENEKLKEANKKLRDALISIEEFWNRDANEQAMQGACWHAVETAAAALSEAAEIEGE